MTEREHVASGDCWCQPIVDAYGAEYEYDERGEIAAVKHDPEDAFGA